MLFFFTPAQSVLSNHLIQVPWYRDAMVICVSILVLLNSILEFKICQILLKQRLLANWFHFCPNQRYTMYLYYTYAKFYGPGKEENLCLTSCGRNIVFSWGGGLSSIFTEYDYIIYQKHFANVKNVTGVFSKSLIFWYMKMKYFIHIFSHHVQKKMWRDLLNILSAWHAIMDI